MLAQDTHSNFLRNRLWVDALKRWEKLFKLPPLSMAIASEGDMIRYVSPLSSWQRSAKAFFDDLQGDLDRFEALIGKAHEEGERMNAFTERFLDDLTKLPPATLVRYLKRFLDLQETVYAYGVAVPLVEVGGTSFIDGRARAFLKERAPGRFQEHYETISFPHNRGFGEEQEIALLEIFKEVARDERLIRIIEEEEGERLVRDLGEEAPWLVERLEQHARDHGWIYYVYSGPAYGVPEFLLFLKDLIRKGIEPEAEIARRKGRHEEMRRRRERIITELRPDASTRRMLHLIGKIVWGKPRRKDYQSRSYWHAESLYREIGRRLGLTLDQVRNLPMEELEAGLLEGKRPDLALYRTIKECHCCLDDDGTLRNLFGKEAKRWIAEHVEEEAPQDAARELQGSCACAGPPVRGTARIVNGPEAMGKMRYGDILVAYATTPAIVTAMRKAAAIVTDEGGLTCHAAIVSRELGTPCVVGVRMATSAIKDGDTVEVDAKEGRVRILPS